MNAPRALAIAAIGLATLLGNPSAEAKRCKKSSCCTSYVVDCGGCYSSCGGCYSGCYSGCGYDAHVSYSGYSGCSGCGSSVVHGSVIEGAVIEGGAYPGQIIEGSIIEGSIIEGSIIEGSPVEQAPPASEAAPTGGDSPFITRSAPNWIPVTTDRIVRAAVASPNRDHSLLVGAASPPARQTQDFDTARLFFGQAAHRYWARDYLQTVALAEEGIAAADEDARLWYFKGLAEIAMGQDEAGAESLGMAVRVQALHPEHQRQIGVALQRVQGGLRARIEAARAAAHKRLPQPAEPQAPGRIAFRNR